MSGSWAQETRKDKDPLVPFWRPCFNHGRSCQEGVGRPLFSAKCCPLPLLERGHSFLARCVSGKSDRNGRLCSERVPQFKIPVSLPQIHNSLRGLGQTEPSKVSYGCGLKIGTNGTLCGSMGQNLRSIAWWFNFDPYPRALEPRILMKERAQSFPMECCVCLSPRLQVGPSNAEPRPIPGTSEKQAILMPPPPQNKLLDDRPLPGHVKATWTIAFSRQAEAEKQNALQANEGEIARMSRPGPKLKA